MPDIEVEGAPDRAPQARYRGRILILSASAAAVPWLILAFVASDPAARPAPAIIMGPLLLTAVILVALVRALRPIGEIAEALRVPMQLEMCIGLPRDRTDEPGVIMAGVADLAARISSLHHRWTQRHPLTALPTREYLLDEMARDLESEPDRMLLGIVRFGDFDRLAAFDPAAAEEGIRSFAVRLAAAAGKTRPLAHVDRDCFAIWFRNACDLTTAATELEAICYTLRAEVGAGTLKLVPDVTVGVAVYPRDGMDPAALITRALVTLKRTGSVKEDILGFAVRESKARERFTLEQDLRHAIAREQFELHYQPVVDIAARRLVGAEALLRWHHPTAGMISPSRFVPILEESGLTDEVGMWTLNAACREAHRWQTQGLEDLKVAVNLSARQLRDPQLKDMIRRTLRRHKLSPEVLEIELTETVATEGAERTLALFTELRATGISLAIDDFGSGYSSLSYVKNLPFDKLKIDREFVVKVHERRDSQAICRCLIELARGLGLKLLAEGVEREEEVNLLRSFGCTLFQGYFFSRPLSGEEFLRRAHAPEMLGPSVPRDALSMIEKRIAQ